MQTVKLVLKESNYKSILTRGYRNMWSLILLPWLDFLTQEQSGCRIFLYEIDK